MRPLLLDFADGSQWAASVMGGGGIETGLAIYSELDDLYALLDAENELAETFLNLAGTSLSITFDPRGVLDRAMQREVAKAGWPVAGPDAYPKMMVIHAPERRATPAHVRRVTAALRAIAVVSTGGNPQAACGVKVTLVAFTDDAAWPAPEAATPCLPAGPGADPAAGYWNALPPAELARVEAERLARLATWLNRQKKPTKGLRAATLRNGEHWAEFLVAQGMPAGAVTEYELRLFVFGFYRRSGTTKAASQVLPNSLRLLFRFLEKEGIEYPFGERVIADLEAVLRDRTRPGEAVLDVLDDIAPELFLDLNMRALVPNREIPGVRGGWPTLMNHTVVRLQRELHRRWLEWHDEEVARGRVDLAELHDVLLARQRKWETTGRPDLEGRTPAEAVDAWNREQAKQQPGAERSR